MKKIPEGFHTMTPCIIVKDGKGAIAFYEKALGAKVMGCIETPDSGKIAHACLQIGSSMLFLYDENEKTGCKAPQGDASPVSFYLYVEDVDAAHKKAVSAGIKELQAPTDMFWGDRMSMTQDPFGYNWSFATHTKDVSPEELEAGMKQMS